MSIENSRYTLSKNGDNIVLTDKKDKKTRILTADDVDYVIDDNQKLRDVNIIENYFKLKEEPYEPKLITKTADLKKEYEQAEKQYKNVPQDLVEQFIKRFKLNQKERNILGEIPEETTFKKFTWKTEGQQREMVNAFRELKNDLKEKEKISTDPFTYLKAYFKNYITADDIIDVVDMSLDAFLKNDKMYDSKSEYRTISSITDIKNLDDVKKKTQKFLNLNLNDLQKFCNKISSLYKILNNNNDKYFVIEDKVDELHDIPVKYHHDCALVVNDVLAENVFIETYAKKATEANYNNYGPFVTIIIKNIFIDSMVKISKDAGNVESNFVDVMSSIYDSKLKYFDSAAKVKLLMKLINKNGSKKTFDIKIYGFYRIPGSENFINYKEFNFFYSQNKDNEINPKDEFTKMITKGGRNKNGTNYLSFLKLLTNTVDGPIGKGEYLTNKSVGSGWTDKTLTRIEEIENALRNVGSGYLKGSGWTDKTLTRIDDILDTLRNIGSGKISSGWTDKTLTRIENIQETLRNI